MQPRIACIVEGHGEVVSIPVIIRRIGVELAQGVLPLVDHPIRVPKSRLLNNPGELERLVELRARGLSGKGGVVILVDSDDDCAREVGDRLRQRSRAARSDVLTLVVLAVRELEAWYIAAAASLSGKNGMKLDLSPPANPEGIRDAKGWLATHRRGGNYSSVVDQPRFAAVFDLQEASSCRSFRKFSDDILSMLKALEETP